MKRSFYVLVAIMVAGFFTTTGCEKDGEIDDELKPVENREQIRTHTPDDGDSIPPGFHPDDNDDDDPYGGKYDGPFF